MRGYTENERLLIKKLIELYAPTSTTTIGDVLFEVHKLRCLQKVNPDKWEQANIDVERYRKVNVAYYQYKGIDFELQFYESIVLIEYLEQNRYIILSQLFERDTIGEDDSSLSPLSPNGDGMSTSFNIFNNFTQDLWRTLSSTYIITNSLVDFAKDFKTPEQRRFEQEKQMVEVHHKEAMVKVEKQLQEERIRFKKQLADSQQKHDASIALANTQLIDAQSKHNEAMGTQKKIHKDNSKLTKIGIGVAIGIGIIGIVLNIWALLKPTTLAEKEEIINAILSTKTELPAIIETKITNDTIKVDVVKSTPIQNN